MKIEATRIIQYPGRDFKVEYRINEQGEIFSPWHGWSKMSTHLNRNGYENIYLHLNDGSRKCFKVHRLVLNTFKPVEDSEQLQVNHINGIKDDNRLENLEWCTRSENLVHAFKTGLEQKPAGEKNPKYKLTEQQVIEICNKLVAKQTLQSIADEYGVSKGTISHIRNKRTWQEITSNYNFN